MSSLLAILRRPRNDKRYIIIIGWLAILLGVVFRFNQLPNRVVYLDESYTQIRVAGHTAAEMIQALYDGHPAPAAIYSQATRVGPRSTMHRLVYSLEQEDAQHPPLFYLAELGAVRLLGNSLLAWRALPAFFGVLSIIAAYSLGRELFCASDAGLMAAALFAVSPIERIYSDQAREYSLFVFLTLLASLVAAQAIRVKSVKRWALYAMIMTIGLYTDPFMGYVLAGHAIFVIGSSDKNNRLINFKAFVAAAISALIAYTPWLYQLYLHRNDITQTNVWSGTRWPLVRLAIKWAVNTGSTVFDLEYIDVRWTIALAIVSIFALIAICRGFDKANKNARWCIASTIGVPALMLIIPDLILGQHRSSVARYGLPSFAMMSILVAGGITRRPVVATILLAAGACSVAVGSLYPSWWDNDSNADDACIASLINYVPNAQVISTISPPEFVVFGRLLRSDVRVSLSANLANIAVSTEDSIFLLRPSSTDLITLQKKLHVAFVPVSFERTVTAHAIGNRIGIHNQAVTTADLYRMVNPGIERPRRL